LLAMGSSGALVKRAGGRPGTGHWGFDQARHCSAERAGKHPAKVICADGAASGVTRV
jgi:hypothetical protein